MAWRLGRPWFGSWESVEVARGERRGAMSCR
jgi:hypothetical protein